MDKRDSILSQIPLIISPGLRPPQAVTLPFNYNRLPQQAPPPTSAVTTETLEQIKTDSEQFVETVQARTEARQTVYKEWIDNVRKQAMDEKRRIAPGYLDSANRILQPTRTGSSSVDHTSPPQSQPRSKDRSEDREDSELDQVFGKVSLN